MGRIGKLIGTIGTAALLSLASPKVDAQNNITNLPEREPYDIQYPFLTADIPKNTFLGLWGSVVFQNNPNDPKYPEFNVDGNIRFHPKSIPVIADVGISGKHEARPRLLWGLGYTGNIDDKFYFVPTIEGYQDKFRGATVYTSTKLGKWFIDAHPSYTREFEKENDMYVMSDDFKGSCYLTVGRELSKNGYYSGVSTTYRDNEFRDIYLRVGRVDRGGTGNWGVGVGTNPRDGGIKVNGTVSF